MYQKKIGLCIFYGNHEDSKCITYFFGLYFQFIMISLKTRNHSYCQSFLKKPFFFSYEVAKNKRYWNPKKKTLNWIFMNKNLTTVFINIGRWSMFYVCYVRYQVWKLWKHSWINQSVSMQQYAIITKWTKFQA